MAELKNNTKNWRIKNMKKLCSALLMVSMITVTACSSNTTTSSAPAQAPAQKQAANKEPVTITMALKTDAEFAINLVKEIEKGMNAEGHNIKIELVQVQAGTYSEKLGLLLQTGNIPDMMYFQGGDYQFAITQKILEDLSPYIEKSKFLKASMTPYNLERIKNYPYLVYPFPTETTVPVVRQDWFNKTTSGAALLKDPTIDNYYTFFKELKEKNGSKYVYTIPGILDELDTTFSQAFGLTSSWIKEDGKFSFGVTTKLGLNKLEFYAKLYKEGLLDPEFLVKKFDTKEKAFYDGVAGVMAGRQGGTIKIYHNKSTAQNGEAGKLMVLPPAKGVAQGYSPIDVSKESRGFAISKLSKNKELAFAVLDYMGSPKGLMLDLVGVEGQEYTITNNKIKFTEKGAAWYSTFVGNSINFKREADFDPSTPFMPEPQKKSLEIVKEMSSKDNVFVIPNELAVKWLAAETVYKEFAADMVTGKKTAANFAKFVQDWNAAGGKEVTEYANKTLK
jgi:putative aldouronate transport system substrate-binding protein